MINRAQQCGYASQAFPQLYPLAWILSEAITQAPIA